MDFGITTRPCCKLQRTSTWAGVLLLYFFATAKIVGWLSLLPLVNGRSLTADNTVLIAER
jgi:hypothetical protein